MDCTILPILPMKSRFIKYQKTPLLILVSRKYLISLHSIILIDSLLYPINAPKGNKGNKGKYTDIINQFELPLWVWITLPIVSNITKVSYAWNIVAFSTNHNI